MGQKFDKFVLLLWKNWILQLRHPIQTVFEIFVPVFFCVVLVLIRSLVNVSKGNEVAFPQYDPFNQSLITNRFDEIAVSPISDAVNEILAGIQFEGIQITHKANSKDLESYLFAENSKRKAGIAFDDSLAGSNELPHKIEFTIRYPAEIGESSFVINNWETELIYPRIQFAGARDPYNYYSASPDYYETGFLTLQEAISNGIIKQVNKNNERVPSVLMNRFPYPSYVSDPLMEILQLMIGMIIVLSFVYTSISIIKVITVEKETQIKEAMKIMGLPSWIHWLAWFTKSIVFMLISIIIMIILFKTDAWYAEDVNAILPKCDFTVLFVFLFLYACSTITLCFMISVFFTKANLAAGIGGVAFFFCYVPYSLLQNKYQTLSLSTKLASSLAANSAMGYGFQLLCLFESTEEGLQWTNLWKTATPDDNLVMGHILLMLVADTFIYLLIALYVEAVFPGKYGVPKKWNFIFTWICSKKGKQEDFIEETSMDPTSFETDPNMYAGIKIHNLRKVYGKDKVAVRNLSFNMYENQITVLLGHNGAGKTTTMSMLTGMYTPTSGTAIINNFDIRTDIGKVRSSLGLCPQHNILFDDLTVAEHIYFYSKLKGMPKKEINHEIDHYVKLLQLEDKKNKQSSTLSGGMKRKLSVAVAFCGNSKVVMLDEPTAGMDPAARRALWELVESQKKGRTIMLTTHFMDEADLLGDRIAIMAGGKLQCCGSSFFLKKRYGAGYHLIIDKSATCNINAINEVIKTHIPDIEIHSNIGSELTYLLNEKDAPRFKAMLQSIESQTSELGIRSYGISLTTLEDVFMRVGADHGQEEINNMNEANKLDGSVLNIVLDNEKTKSTEILISTNEDNQVLTGYNLRLNQVKAMFMKRILSTWRSWPLMLVQFLIPIFLLVVSILSARASETTDLPKLPITLNSYDKPVILLQSTEKNNVYYQAGKTWIEDQNKRTSVTNNIFETILELTSKDPGGVRLHYQIGGSFDTNKIVGWFNNDPYHTPPLVLNFMMNSILKSIDTNYEIAVNNHPLPFRIESKIQLLQQGNNMGFQMAVNIGFCMAFISAFYILFYIKERVCKAKHLQMVSGANIIIFWTVSFIWDWCTYIVTIIILLITLLCFQEDGFKTAEDIGHLIVIFLYFGFSMFPLVYISSLKFDTPTAGFIRVVLFAVMLGNFGFMVVEIISFEAFDLSYVAKPLDWIFLFIPHYSLAAGIRNINVEFSQFKICKDLMDSSRSFCMKPEFKICCERSEAYYAWEKPGILRNIVISLTVGVVAIIVLFMKEYKVFAEIGYYFQKKNLGNKNAIDEDDDVLEETNRIKQMSPGQIKEQSLVLLNVSKTYKKFRAVNNICLGVNSNECFGLLGVNGAGKTTTFKMMTGDTRISEGDVFVKGLNLKKQSADVNKLIGYCPQFDAILEDLTARETITMFALLRGYTQPYITHLAIKLAQDFDFIRHIDKKVKELSGGNKRKLSTAVALIGNPPILYLDEPTTGMDPAAKRFLWNALCKIRDSGKCLILTSHSMEECEALCTRLAIMVNGGFKCLGSTQHLKNKFSQGYTLTVKLGKNQNDEPVSSEPVERHIINCFPSAMIRERHQELITFYIPDTTVTWSSMFGVLEEAKTSFDIEDYSLGQSTLEQVFLTFTKQQIIASAKR